ncbi:MAG: TetR/AcrR family transcriptional regulator C-terminal domain-containing protein [Gammaproteobacteria bacterium]
MDMLRCVMGECAGHPPFARLFYAPGPETGVAALRAVLVRRARAGEPAVDDADYAACLFFAMLQSTRHTGVVTSVHAPSDAGERGRHVDRAVRQCLELCAA